MLKAIITAKGHEKSLHWLSEHASAHLKDPTVPFRTPTFLAHIPVDLAVDAPDGTKLSVALVLHLPNDVPFDSWDFSSDTPSVSVTGSAVKDLPEHAPEARGHAVGPHGHTDPQIDVTVSADGTFDVTVTASLHPLASFTASGKTGTLYHLEMPPTDPTLNG